ncbi:ATP-binding protein [uncultured Thiodictyon sp.]|uniref:ATP-binding protein n=1 Tax=uncultured Thiodictyon sp. TaxID=1846217 RepID=UPI0025E2C00E|nr:ATP-binding protein [uncultured Thiodictyon sp.]
MSRSVSTKTHERGFAGAEPSKTHPLVRALGPVVLVLVGFLTLVGIALYVDDLSDQFDQPIADGWIRLQGVEQVVQDLIRIEASVYQLASTRGGLAQARLGRALRTLIESTQARLTAMAGARNRPDVHSPQTGETITTALSDYPLEVGDLVPTLTTLSDQVALLTRLLGERDAARTRRDDQAETQANEALHSFLSDLPPTFFRLSEQATRLLDDGRQRFADLKQQITAQRRQLRGSEALLVAAVVLLVLALTFGYAARLEGENRRRRLAQDAVARERDAADAANRSKSVFLANMSHEIRTPMNAVIGMTSLVLDSELAPKQRHDVKTILNSANALLGLLNDILDFSRIEAQQIQLEQRSFDLVEVIEEVVRTFSDTSRRSGVALYYRIEANFPRAAVGDALRLRQILVNLVGNAFKFTTQGHVRIDAGLAEERAGLVTLRLQVSDTGVGIPRNRQAGIFSRFTQADETIYRKHGGAGLGLSISQKLAELMDGRMWVESEPGAGSRFHFTVRLPRAEGRALPKLGTARILVAGTDAIAMGLVCERLTQLGCRAECVFDAAAADARLKAAAAARDPFRVVVLEKCLCDATTTDILTFLREIPVAPELALIALSEPDKQESDRLADGSHVLCITEPLIVGELINHLHDFAQAQRLAAVGTAAPTSAPPRGTYRVLLVEDNHVNSVIARRVLEKDGHQVTEALDGAVALNALAAEDFEVVLMDVQMPTMDGLEATRIIRALEAGQSPERPAVVPAGLPERLRDRHTPVIAMTANAMAGDRELCIATGMDDYITKPFKREEMLETVQRVMRNRPAAAGATADPLST